MFIDLVLAQPATRFIFNLEQLSVLNLDNTVRAYVLSTFGMGSFAGNTVRKSVALTSEGAGSAVVEAAVPGAALGFLPYFLGRQDLTGTAGGLSVLTNNVTGVSYRIYAMGYLWEASARSSPGGPQRPPARLWS